LGFFGQLVVEHGGQHRSTLDLKHRGLIPIVDLARVSGLEAGCTTANTLHRLRASSKGGSLSEAGCTELTDAFETIAGVRLRLHAARITRGEETSNHLDPSELSSAERSHLRDAFSVVRTFQRAMETSRQLGYIGD
jgi:CBS domain-containing protein